MMYSLAKQEQRVLICIEPESNLGPQLNVVAAGMHECDQCHVVFDTPNDLISHQLSTHSTLFCVLCQKKLSTKNKWKRHVNSVHGFGRVYSCWLCEKTAYREDMIYNHVWSAHKVIPCKECKATFPTRGELDQHKINTHGIVTLKSS